MACTLVSSFPFACRDSNGGAQEIKVKIFSESTLSTGWTESSGSVTASGAALTGWYTYYCEKATANFVDAGATNVQNGTSSYTETVTFIYNKLQLSFRNELKALGQARIWVAVKDNNGTSWLFGYTRGMDLTSSESASGTAYEDRSGYTLTFTGMEPNPIVSISNYTSLVTS
jgi:hypothetical protein